MEALAFRIEYDRWDELRADIVQQLDRGGLMVKVAPTDEIERGAKATITLRAPDGATFEAEGEVLHLFPGTGIAVSVPPSIATELRRHAAWKPEDAADAAHARHALVRDTPSPAPEAPPATDAGAVPEGLTNAEKIHLAVHGTRDERNAILRDKNKALHAFVLKNPQLTVEDVAQIARNPQASVDLLKQIGERKDWMQRPAVALALARNPKTPPDLGVRALDHVGAEALRQMAKGIGALPHIVQAARKKVIAK